MKCNEIAIVIHTCINHNYFDLELYHKIDARIASSITNLFLYNDLSFSCLNITHQLY